MGAHLAAQGRLLGRRHAAAALSGFACRPPISLRGGTRFGALPVLADVCCQCLSTPADLIVGALAAYQSQFPADQFNSGVMVITPSAARFDELMRWNAVNGTAEGGDQCLLNEFFGEWYYSAWDEPEAGKLPWGMNLAAAHWAAYKTLAKMQARDEPVVAHFVGGEGKPWHFMVLKFQGHLDRVPPSHRRLLDAWDTMYWLAKVCARP